MPIKPLFGETYSYLEKSLDIAKRQHAFISSNIANIDTPGYSAREIDFKSTLKNAMEGSSVLLSRTNERHLGGAATQMGYIMSSRDQGQMDLDVEMSKLAQNNLKYRMASEAVSRQMQKAKTIFSSGG
ncbi:Flagellar basal-body rod protein flgB [Candidatus Magnetomorum sp. HK-1]|nr:Flagellar basal-body rod protein flgB [Candidatus Magnetomorum sp. HK-1]